MISRQTWGKPNALFGGWALLLAPPEKFFVSCKNLDKQTSDALFEGQGLRLACFRSFGFCIQLWIEGGSSTSSHSVR